MTLEDLATGGWHWSETGEHVLVRNIRMFRIEVSSVGWYIDIQSEHAASVLVQSHTKIGYEYGSKLYGSKLYIEHLAELQAGALIALRKLLLNVVLESI